MELLCDLMGRWQNRNGLRFGKPQAAEDRHDVGIQRTRREVNTAELLLAKLERDGEPRPPLVRQGDDIRDHDVFLRHTHGLPRRLDDLHPSVEASPAVPEQLLELGPKHVRSHRGRPRSVEVGAVAGAGMPVAQVHRGAAFHHAVGEHLSQHDVADEASHVALWQAPFDREVLDALGERLLGRRCLSGGPTSCLPHRGTAARTSSSSRAVSRPSSRALSRASSKRSLMMTGAQSISARRTVAEGMPS